jgi:hypothetical protein
MTPNKRAIFRADALQRYIASREVAVLPRFIAPPMFLLLWGMLGLLAAGASLVLAVPIPVYASGPAVALSPSGPWGASHDDATVLVCLPPSTLGEVGLGQGLILTSQVSGLQVGAQIIAVDRTVSSPAAIRERFALDPAAGQAISQPAVAVLARLALHQDGGPAKAYAGSTYRAEIRIGAQRVVTFLPVVGSLVGGSSQ